MEQFAYGDADGAVCYASELRGGGRLEAADELRDAVHPSFRNDELQTMTVVALYLYIMLCDGSDGCKIRSRHPMPDWKTCQFAASTFKLTLPEKTTENEGGAGVFCASGQEEKWTDGWHVMPGGK